MKDRRPKEAVCHHGISLERFATRDEEEVSSGKTRFVQGQSGDKKTTAWTPKRAQRHCASDARGSWMEEKGRGRSEEQQWLLKLQTRGKKTHKGTGRATSYRCSRRGEETNNE